MTINILFDFIDGPYGGGNQFLKALRDFFIKENVFEKNPELADIILFNSHHKFKQLIKLRKKHPEKIFIQRIDGPVSLIRKNDKRTDKLISAINNYVADAVIFQSEWSKKENIKIGIGKNDFETIIINAPNPQIFNKLNKVPFNSSRKTKIIATSWSCNMRKGFKTYKQLDEQLDFSKYEMTFCGNSPFKFKNIKLLKPIPSKELARVLKEHDIYITASQKDPCSNSLIEALHCGLPAIGLNDGGHPEIIGKGGLIFNSESEILQHLKTIENNYSAFQNNINLPTMPEIGKKYMSFMQNVKEQKKQKHKTNFLKLVRMKKNIVLYHVFKKINI